MTEPDSWIGISIKNAFDQLSVEKVCDITGVPIDTVRLFYWRLTKADVIANILGEYPLMQMYDGNEGHHRIYSKLGMQFDISIMTLSSLLNGQWLCSSIIVGVLAINATLAPKVQLFSPNWAQYICEKINQNCHIFDHYAPSLDPTTDIIVWSINVAGDHWCVIKITYEEGASSIMIFIFNHTHISFRLSSCHRI